MTLLPDETILSHVILLTYVTILTDVAILTVVPLLIDITPLIDVPLLTARPCSRPAPAHARRCLQAVQRLTSRAAADETRAGVWANMTHDVLYYRPAFHAVQRAAGTTHVSLIGPRGEAVAVTSTINL